MIDYKKCTCCNLLKPYGEFHKDIHRNDSLGFYCKGCISTNHKKLRNKPRQKEKIRLYHEKRNKTPEGKYMNLKGGAKRKGRVFGIKKKEFLSWFGSQKMNCHYCDTVVVFGNGNGNLLNSLTIDRFNNDIGYVVWNLVICCRRCNTVKGSWLTGEQMVKIGTKYFKGKEL